jgi:DNA-binding NarL/FixJ family response regulator
VTAIAPSGSHGTAAALVVSEAAVRKHVGSIFAKLQLDPASDRRVSAVLTYLRG